MHRGAKPKLRRWLEVMTPLLVRFREKGFNPEVEQVDLSGDENNLSAGSRFTAKFLFDKVLPEEWVKKKVANLADLSTIKLQTST